MAPILPTRLRKGQALQLVVPSYDGHLYVVDGITGGEPALPTQNPKLNYTLKLNPRSRYILQAAHPPVLLLALHSCLYYCSYYFTRAFKFPFRFQIKLNLLFKMISNSSC